MSDSIKIPINYINSEPVKVEVAIRGDMASAIKQYDIMLAERERARVNKTAEPTVI